MFKLLRLPNHFKYQSVHSYSKKTPEIEFLPICFSKTTVPLKTSLLKSCNSRFIMELLDAF